MLGAHLHEQRIGRRQQLAIGGGQRAGRRDPAIAVPGDHRQRTLREIAEIVGEIGIDAIDDRFVAVIAVLAERHLAQEEIAQRVDAVARRPAHRVR